MRRALRYYRADKLTKSQMIPCNAPLILQLNAAIITNQSRPPALLLINFRLVDMIPRTMYPSTPPNTSCARSALQAGRSAIQIRRLVVHGIIQTLPTRSAHNARLLIRAALQTLSLVIWRLPSLP